MLHTLVQRSKAFLRSAATTTTTATRSMSDLSLSSLTGPPICSLVPPGQCQFGEAFVATKLMRRTPVSPTSAVLRFQLPDVTRPLGLSTCACLLLGCDAIPNTDSMIVRPYTPISTNADIGTVDLLVKNYGAQGGLMSRYLHEIQEGDTSIQMKHIPFNVKIQASEFAGNNRYEHIVMLVGGTGITPMIQALHAILGDAERSKTKVTMLYGSKTSDDILGAALLRNWAASFPDRFRLVDILSDEPADSEWSGERGFIDRAKLEKYLPTVAADQAMIFVCGPPPMYQALCGPRDEPAEIKGLLGAMGYGPSQVYKF
jgi:cytochrome-b5 reductase